MIRDLIAILRRRGFTPLLLSLVFPLLASSVLGLWKAFELGIAGFMVLAVAVFWACWLPVHFFTKRKQNADAPLPRTDLLARLEPVEGWTPTEVSVFQSFKLKIHAEHQHVIPWSDMPKTAQALADEAIQELSAGRRNLGSLTAPQALLLIERLASRYRSYLKANVPFAETVNLGMARWAAENQKMLTIGWKTARKAQQISALAIDPATAMMAEGLKQITLGNRDLLNEGILPELQAILLEEVVRSAIDLEGGRLRYSEQELAAERLASTGRDLAARVKPDDPLRVIVIGQVSAGKSSLVNALSGTGMALTDSAPTQTEIQTHSFKIDALEATLVDTPGIDGTAQTNELLAQEIQEADLCIWVSKANRPGRKYDQELQDFVDQWFIDHHQHRKPAIIRVLSHVDGIDGVELEPDGTMSFEDSSVIGSMVKQVKAELGDGHVVPVVLEPTPWNLNSLHEALESHAITAINVQRNRKQHVRAKKESSVGALARKGSSAASEALRLGVRVITRS